MNFEKHECMATHSSEIKGLCLMKCSSETLKHKPLISEHCVFIFCHFIGPPICPKLSELKTIVPANIWSASNIDENITPIIGTTIDFKCPEHLKLSSGQLKIGKLITTKQRVPKGPIV